MVFPYTFRKPGEPLISENDRHGDPTLKERIELNESGQHDAIVTWIVEGAMAWYADKATSMQVTDRIVEDTKSWRMTADRIMSYWDARLEADRDSCVMATHLVDDFNSWLQRAGHNSWPTETFSSRFLAHELATSNGITKVQTKKLDGLSQRFKVMDEKAKPERATVYKGVRFINEADFGLPF